MPCLPTQYIRNIMFRSEKKLYKKKCNFDPKRFNPFNEIYFGYFIVKTQNKINE